MKKTLVCALGLSPQVLTETIYGLAVANKTPWVPDEIFVITTEQGLSRLELDLLHPKTGKLHELCKEYDLPAMAIPRENVLVLTDADGLLTDIRTPQDNLSAADQVAKLMQKLTLDVERELHVSLAGGRKTMGFYLGYALSIFGRDQDRLSHVLVDEPFENLRDFYFPTKESKVLHDIKGNPLDASTARVMLGLVPFFPMRQWIPMGIQTESLDYGSIIGKIKAGAPRLEVTIDLYTGEIEICGKRVNFTPANTKIYAWALWVRKHGLYENGVFNIAEKQVLEDFVTFSGDALSGMMEYKSDFYQSVKDILRRGDDCDEALSILRTQNSRIKTRLMGTKDGIGDVLSELQIKNLLVDRVKINNRPHYGLVDLNDRSINLINERESLRKLASVIKARYVKYTDLSR